MNYSYPDDGKLHVRYSSLQRATPGQAERLVRELRGELKDRHTSQMDFGTTRHDMWRDETLETGMTPACFGLNMPIDHTEEEFASEIFKGVVLHSRPDAVSVKKKTVVDYKTIGGRADQFSKSMQLPVYAYQLGVHGIDIKWALYACEVWNKERTEIVRYESYMRRIGILELSVARSWLKDRVEILKTAITVLEDR